MTTNTNTTAASGAASQPEALRLAAIVNSDGYISNIERRQIVAELCRMHALTTAAPAAQAADLESLRGKISRIGLDIDRALAGEVVEQSPVEGRLKQIAALARAAAPAAQEAEPAGYLSPEVIGPDGRLKPGSALTFSRDKCHAWTMPIFTAAPRPQADADPSPELQRMTAHRAVFFLERFLREENLLGPNEQAAVRFAVAALSAAPQAPAAPTAAAASDEDEALDLLDALFAAWEDGTPCYDEPDSAGSFLGNAFRLDDATFHRCVELLERRRSRQISATPAPAAGAAPSETDDACAWTVWWTHHKARYTTPRQAALAAWSAAIDRERAADAEPSIRGQFRWAARAVLARWGAAAPAQEAEDAARYRWLRDVSVPPHNFYLSVPDEFKDERYTRDQVDAAIDAARARQEGGAA